MGGAGLFASFLDAGEPDALIVQGIPTPIGEGIPIFAPTRRNVRLARKLEKQGARVPTRSPDILARLRSAQGEWVADRGRSSQKRVSPGTLEKPSSPRWA